VPLAESVRGTPHRNAPPRVPRPRRGAERNAPALPAARLPHLLPPLPDPPLPGEGRTGAQTGGAPRPGRNRREAHGRGRASSVRAAGCVRSCLPAGCTGRAEVGGQRVPLAVLALPPLRGRNPHGPSWSTLGVLRSQGPVRQTNGRSRSSEHLDGLSGRDR